MRTLKILPIAFILVILTSFQKKGANEIDKKLVGIWKGIDDTKQQEGIERHWIVNRLANGTYTIMFTVKENCEIDTQTEKGTWWTKNGVFYEKNQNNFETDSYKYSIKENLVVHFKSQKSDYEFDDFRID